LFLHDLAMQAGAFQQRADPRQQLAREERLDQVVVGSGVQSFDTRLFAGARREQDDRQVAQRLVLAQRLDDTEAVEPRHHHVGDDDIGALAAYCFERRPAIAHRLDLIVGREQPGDVGAHVGIVVGQQHAGAESGSEAPVGDGFRRGRQRRVRVAVPVQ